MITNQLLIEALNLAKNIFDDNSEYEKCEAIEEYLKELADE